MARCRTDPAFVEINNGEGTQADLIPPPCRTKSAPASEVLMPLNDVNPGATRSIPKSATQSLIVSAIVLVTALLMHPQISVTDSDAYNYIQGAYSFQAAHEYRNLNGDALNVEPPAYSILLAGFRSPLRAAIAINYISLGLAAGLVYLLAENAGWSSLASAGLALVLGVGFLRNLAVFAKPDILNYAIFLLGARCVADDSGRLRTLGGCLWALLTPLKLVSVVFVPAMLASDYLLLTERRPLSFARYAIIVVIWASAVAGILAFNYLTIGAMLVSRRSDIRSYLAFADRQPLRHRSANSGLWPAGDAAGYEANLARGPLLVGVRVRDRAARIGQLLHHQFPGSERSTLRKARAGDCFGEPAASRNRI